jgi:probable O-glycosylation ligase (exosortase A-associated)
MTVAVGTTASARSAEQRRGLGFAFWMMLLYFFFEYVRPQSMFLALEPLRIPMILTLIMPLVWLMVGEKKVLKDPLILMHGAFVALIAFSVTYAANTYWVYQTFLAMVFYLASATIPAAGLLNEERRLIAFFNYWLVFHVIITAWALAHQGRAVGFSNDENDLALTLNMAIPFAYYLMQSPRASLLQRILYACTIAILATGVIVSLSRGGFLGLAAVGLGVIYFSRQRLRNLLIVGIFGLVALFFVPNSYVEEMQTINDTTDSTRVERFHSWGLGWDMFMDHPLLGVGAFNYPWRVAEYEYRSEGYDPRGRRSLGGRVSHSVYFTVIPELGLVGTLLFFAVGWTMYRRLRGIIRQDKSDTRWLQDTPELPLLARAMVVSLVGFAVTGAFISVLYYPHFWVLVGFVLALQGAVAKQRARYRPAPTPATAGRAGEKGDGVLTF